MLNKIEFGRRLKKLRGQLNNGKGLTQADFAKEVGVTAASISAYEAGTKTPNIEIAFDISEKFNISIDWLCGKVSDDKKDIDIMDAFKYDKIPMTKILQLISFFVESGICHAIIDRDVIECYNENGEFEEYNDYAELKFYIKTIFNYINDIKQLINVLEKGLLTDDVYRQSRNGVISKSSDLYWDIFEERIGRYSEDEWLAELEAMPPLQSKDKT